MIAVSKKLSHIGLSAAHNEYMALHWATRHVSWLRELLTELGYAAAVDSPTVVYGDNKAANTLAEEDILTYENQFISIPYHYVKQEVKAGNVTVEYVKTTENIADLYTKAVSVQTLSSLVAKATGYLKEAAAAMTSVAAALTFWQC